MQKDTTNTWALWWKVGNLWLEWFTWVMNVDWVNYKLKIRKNNYKMERRHPDYLIFDIEMADEQPAPRTLTQEDDDSLPF